MLERPPSTEPATPASTTSESVSVSTVEPTTVATAGSEDRPAARTVG